VGTSSPVGKNNNCEAIHQQLSGLKGRRKIIWNIGRKNDKNRDKETEKDDGIYI
jgi:hypothetical protein